MNFKNDLIRAFAKLLALATILVAFGLGAVAQSPPPMMEVEVPAGKLTGLPIHWDARSAILIEPAGSFQELNVADVRQHHITSEAFNRSRSRMQDRLCKPNSAADSRRPSRDLM